MKEVVLTQEKVSDAKIPIFDRKSRRVGLLLPSLPLGQPNRSEKRHLKFSRIEKKRRRQEEIAKKRVANVV